MGCIEANHPIPLGIVSTGANAELIKGRIKRGNSSPVAPSADFEKMCIRDRVKPGN